MISKFKYAIHTACIICCAVLLSFAACSDENTAEDAAPRLTVNKTQLTVIKTGRLDAGSRASIEILANLGYEIQVDKDWIKPAKTSGRGIETIIINVDENDSGEIRVGHINVKSEDLTETITVTQTMDPSSDDGNNIGYIYLNEDFAWLPQYGGMDQVANPANSTTIPLTNAAAATARTRFKNSGYEDFNTAGSCFYLAHNYVKMGKTNQQTGFAFTLQQVAAGKSSNMKLSFDVAPNITTKVVDGQTVPNNIDAVEITVEILSGPGTINNSSAKKSSSMKLSNITSWGQWEHMEVELYGVRSTSKVVIRSTQQGTTGVFRWFLDNVKLEKIEIE